MFPLDRNAEAVIPAPGFPTPDRGEMALVKFIPPEIKHTTPRLSVGSP